MAFITSKKENMRKIFNELKLFLAIVLSVAIIVAETPLTAYAASTEVVNESAIEMTVEQAQNEEISDEGTSVERSEESSKDDAANTGSVNEESSGEKTNNDFENVESTEEEKTDSDSENEESTGEEKADNDSENEESTGEEKADTDSENEESTGEEKTDTDSENEEGSEDETDEEMKGEASEEEDLENEEGDEGVAEESVNDEESSEEAEEELDESEELAGEISRSSEADFVVSSDGVLTGYTGTAAEVEIPEGVVTINASVFKGNKTMETVRFSSTVTTIGNSAFENCTALKEVVMNEGLVTIGRFAFRGAALGKMFSTGVVETGTIVIPSTVTNINYGAFYGCSYLGEVRFEDGDTEGLALESQLQYGVIAKCPNLTKIELPSRLTGITMYAFQENAKLTEVVFKDKIKTIGEKAFSKCSSLKSIDLPESVKTIGDYAFESCSSLSSVDLKEGLETIGNMAFSGAALGKKLSTGKVEAGALIIPGTVTGIGGGAFYNCTYLGEVQFKDGEAEVLALPYSVWGVITNCPNLRRIELPSRLTAIPREAFEQNVKLTEVVFGDKIQTIGEKAFSKCSSLKSIDLPASVTKIENNAFSECSSLSSVDLKEGLITIGSNAFYRAALGEKNSTGTLIIPGTVRSIDTGAFEYSEYLGKVIFANGAAVDLTIYGVYGRGVFAHCPRLTTVILPERITALASGTFADEPNLQTLYIPENVTSFERNAVDICPKLTIYGISGSTAESYAKSKNIPFKTKDKLNIKLNAESVKLTPAVIEKVGESVIGSTARLRANVLPDTAQNKSVSYVSADEAVATVSKSGLVTINGYGETTITVTTADGGKTAKCDVIVLKEAIDERPVINSVLFPAKKTEYSAIYTGEQIRPTMAVAYQYTDDKGRTKSQNLKLNVDYTVFYSKNVNSGENTAKVTVRGIGEYKGVITKEFTIKPKSIKNVALSQVGDITYGEEPSVVVMDGTYELTKGTDYNVVLSTTGSANADTQSILTVEGVGNYTGTSKKSVKFNILKTGTDIHPIESETVSVEFKKLPAKGYTYNGKAQKPAVVVTDTTTKKKVASSNYRVIYTNNINAGTATVRVVGVSKNGKGYYGISKPLTFEIKEKDFSKVKVSTKGLIPKAGSIDDIKKAVDEALTVKDGKHVLSEGEYVVDYGNIKNTDDIKIGTKYPITLAAKSGGNYIEGTKKTIYIKFGQLSLASRTANISVRITDADENMIILRYNGTLLERDKDYTAVVKKDKKQNTYTVKIKAVKGSAYKGSRTVKLR